MKEAYLVLYNVVQALGWAAVLGVSALEIHRTSSTDTVFAAAGLLVCESAPAPSSPLVAPTGGARRADSLHYS